MNRKNIIFKAASFIAAAALVSSSASFMPKDVFSGVSLTAFAEQTSGDLTYEKYDDHVAIIGSNYKATSVEIPSSIDGLPVTEIGMYAFNGSAIKSITIPDSVKEIGNWSFALCSDLKSVTIPDSVEKIGIRAFEMCSSLTEVNFPDHMIEISSLAFESTPWLAEQRKKDTFVIVNGDLIDGRNAKGDVVIPSGVEYVSPGAFERNENITSIVFPSSIKKVNDSTFFYCSNLTSADLRYVNEIDSMAFAGCEKLKDVKLSGKLTRIDSYAFADIPARASITVYGSKSDWEKVDKSSDDEFLKNASYTFDESFVAPADDVAGDVNADGVLNTADLVLLSKWLHGNPNTELKNWKAGDLAKDNQLDVFDLILMRKALASKF